MDQKAFAVFEPIKDQRNISGQPYFSFRIERNDCRFVVTFSASSWVKLGLHTCGQAFFLKTSPGPTDTTFIVVKQFSAKNNSRKVCLVTKFPS